MLPIVPIATLLAGMARSYKSRRNNKEPKTLCDVPKGFNATYHWHIALNRKCDESR